MCSKMIIYNATKCYRDRSKLWVCDQDNRRFQAIWEGHVRDDRPDLKADMMKVHIPGVSQIEHHDQIITFSKPKILVGHVRRVGSDNHLGLWVETVDKIVGGIKDRWPRGVEPYGDECGDVLEVAQRKEALSAVSR
jgi:hypothetical protein